MASDHAAAAEPRAQLARERHREQRADGRCREARARARPSRRRGGRGPPGAARPTSRKAAPLTGENDPGGNRGVAQIDEAWPTGRGAETSPLEPRCCASSFAGQAQRMDYTHLGRSGLSVSRLCLGTMNFGPETTEEDSHAIMDRALELGINFFDTANVYGWKKGEGVTEQIVGRWFAQGGGRREKTVIATKLYGSMSDWPNDTFLSARNIRLACDASLQPAADRLHRPLPDAPRRPRHSVGRDLGGVRRPPPAGQGALRRLVQPRRLAHREGQGGGPAPALDRPGQRAVHLQPADARRRARGAARLSGLRPRRHPVVAAARRPARRHHPQDRAGQAPADGPREGHAEGEPQGDQGLRGPLRRARRAARRRRARLAARASRR